MSDPWENDEDKANEMDGNVDENLFRTTDDKKINKLSFSDRFF
jgi:hypothetical protein